MGNPGIISGSAHLVALMETALKNRVTSYGAKTASDTSDRVTCAG